MGEVIREVVMNAAYATTIIAVLAIAVTGLVISTLVMKIANK